MKIKCYFIYFFCGILTLNLAAVVETKQKNAQKYYTEYLTKQQAAEILLKNTIQSAVDDLLEGKFSPRATIEKISNYPKELLPYLKEESLALIIKNIKYNAVAEDFASKELIDDASSILEALCEIYDKSEVLRVLNSGLKTKSTNTALKQKFKRVFNLIKEHIIQTTEKYADLQQQLPYLIQSSEYFDTVSEIDKETMFLIDLIQNNSNEIADLCKSEEIKNWIYQFTNENKEQVKKIARAFVLRFASEIMLESQLKNGCFNFLDMISIITKVLSGFKESFEIKISRPNIAFLNAASAAEQ